ncbi:endonuclease/exonuclease/phosphatase family protein [Pontibacter rugosus]|uniref:Endonuclease/exonuclease/phosphatase family protein n=1 Tax=Pontibacter rugosus TaxID=1745966 RepID=A0ABW3SQL3_9BACT
MTIKNFLYAVMAGATVWVASCSSTSKANDPAPATETGDVVVKKHTLRVMSYNVHHCNPPSRPDFIDIEAIVKTIQAQNPDLVALQEIDVHTQRSGPNNQAEEIAKKLGMHYFFGKAIDYGGGAYGVAILSKFPLADTTVNKLPTKVDTNSEPRVLATAKVTLPDGTSIRFGSTHLDAQKSSVNRDMQAAEIVKIASADKLPFVIAGDFNATPGSETITLLDSHFKRSCEPCSPTIPVNNPTKAIDFISYAPANKFRVDQQQVIGERYASDHLPIVAILKY